MYAIARDLLAVAFEGCQIASLSALGLAMERLVSDLFVRRTAQVLLLLFVALIVGLSIVFNIAVINQFLGKLTVESRWAYTLVHALRVPYQTEFSAFVVALAGVFPTVVAAVCYEIDGSVSPPAPKSTLNGVGHAFFLLLVVGLAASAIAIILFSVVPGAIAGLAADNLAETKDESVPVKGFFTGTLSFLAIYLVQLLGLKPK